MNKAKRKHIPKRAQRQSHKTRTKNSAADPSVALGLRYFTAYRAYVIADAERDEMEGAVRKKYPQAPAEIVLPNIPNPNVLRGEEEIRRLPEPARRKLLLMLWEEQAKRAKIDRQTGYTAKAAQVKRLDKMADALRILWLEEPATTVCGIALKLRAWLEHGDPNPDDEIVDSVALAALADAERLCGVRHMSVLDRPRRSAAFAERTRTDFSAHLGEQRK
jgi:hypothetical protein